MLQDIEAGKPIEIDSIIVAVRELGELTNSPTPNIDTILNLTIQKAKLIGCL
jgi:2-dehydropantoate 2-reductase